MEQLNREYIDILSGVENPSDKFWRLEKRINRDKKYRGVMLQMRMQTVVYDLAVLINDSVITFADIEEFSEDVKDAVRYLCSQTNATER